MGKDNCDDCVYRSSILGAFIAATIFLLQTNEDLALPVTDVLSK